MFHSLLPSLPIHSFASVRVCGSVRLPGVDHAERHMKRAQMAKVSRVFLMHMCKQPGPRSRYERRLENLEIREENKSVKKEKSWSRTTRTDDAGWEGLQPPSINMHRLTHQHSQERSYYHCSNKRKSMLRRGKCVFPIWGNSFGAITDVADVRRLLKPYLQ